jgi:hypothetical protein
VDGIVNSISFSMKRSLAELPRQHRSDLAMLHRARSGLAPSVHFVHTFLGTVVSQATEAQPWAGTLDRHQQAIDQ